MNSFKLSGNRNGKNQLKAKKLVCLYTNMFILACNPVHIYGYWHTNPHRQNRRFENAQQVVKKVFSLWQKKRYEKGKSKNMWTFSEGKF